MVLASCGNKYYRTNFIYAVPSSLLIAPGLRTIQFLFHLELYHNYLKTIQPVNEAADEVSALVYPKMVAYTMVNIQQADDLCVKQLISSISTFALIAYYIEVSMTNQFLKTTSISNGPYLCYR
jgi:hypothetical protein